MRFSVLRPKNLFIVAFSQIATYYLVLKPALNNQSEETILSPSLFGLFVIVTLIIASSGYVINDIYDRATDAINKPNTQHIPTNRDFRMAKTLYFILLSLGAILAFYIAYSIGHLALFIIYPAACSLLFLYAVYFKGKGLSGNLIVAAFCAFVPGVLLYAEKDSYQNLRQKDLEAGDWVTYVFGGYILFAFFSTLVRELIKDIQDVKGDTMQNYKTLPIRIGFDRSKHLALFLYSILIFLCLAWIIYLAKAYWIIYLVYLLLVMFPLVLGYYKLYMSTSYERMKYPSLLLKITMIGGLLFLIIYTQLID